MRVWSRLAIAPLLIGLGGLQTQDQADWDIHRDPRERMVAAYLQTTAGPTLIVRCRSGALTAFISGLPEYEGERRTLGVGFEDKPVRDTYWTSSDEGKAAFSDFPAPLARSFRKGGQFNLVVPGGAEGGRNLRYELALPPSTAAIDETLTACERPLVDPRDVEFEDLEEDGLPLNLAWQRRPTPSYPRTNYARGFAVVSCVANIDGSMRDCVVETEHPHDGRFGEAALSATRRARIAARPGDPPPARPTRVSFRAHFMMPGYETPEDRERMRQGREAARTTG